MREKTETGISKARDNSFKVIFREHELFVQFMRDFINIDILKDVKAEDIEDISERFLPLFQEGRDSDTVKRINLHGQTPLYAVCILEHESKVNFRSAFKMLQYICLVLDDYEKEAEKKEKGVSRKKGFKYPPVLPVIFYDGKDRWTAARNFFDKTELNDVFAKYIPKFEYVLVNLNEYSEQDLFKFADALSLIMLIDKIGTKEDLKLLKDLPSDYGDALRLNIPGNLTKLLSDVIIILLTRMNIPQEEIEEISELVQEKGINKMRFDNFSGYDVQETRRVARAEGLAEGLAEGRTEGRTEERIEVAFNLKQLDTPIDVIVKATGLSAEEIEKL
jgi:predicted transposase/invertase (TIGR01784 family)